MKQLVSIAACVTLAGCQTLMTRNETHLHVGVDRYHMAVSTEETEAQRWFDQGLQLTYGFHHTEAIRSYREALRLDSDCAMAWWGIAYAEGPNINDPELTPERHARAYDASREALKLVHLAQPKEAALITAVAARYASPMPEDVTALNQAYADAMRQAYAAHSDDPNVCTLFADALMNLQPWDYWTSEDQPKGSIEEIVAALEGALAIDATHPGALHLYIHATESGPHPELAVPIADKLRDRIPGSGHLTHMPSHIYAVVGRWSDAADANETAIAVDLATLSNSSEKDFYWGYYGHNLHFLAYAAMMEGRYDAAMRAARQLWRGLPDAYIRENGWFSEGILPTKYHVMVRFGRWQEILAEPEPPGHYLVSVAVQHYARSIAHSALDQTSEARAELEAFERAAERIPPEWRQFNNEIGHIIPIGRAMIRGELLFREGRLEEAFAVLREGAEMEDALVYDEPPGWMIPVRHALGALLMSAGRFEEAEAVYRESLVRNPNNGWDLLGLEQALAAQGKTGETDGLVRSREASWARADVQPTSSCYCEPGRP